MNAPCRGTGQVISGQANRLLRTTSSSCVGRPDFLRTFTHRY